MQSIVILFVLHWFLPFTRADTTTTFVESTSEALFHTEGSGPDDTSTPVVTPVSTVTPSGCSSNSSLIDFCPACGGSVIQYNQFGEYYTFCDTEFANVTYNEVFYIKKASVIDCIGACMGSEHCYAPVIAPGGRCLLATMAPGDEPTLATQPGYAALVPRFTGALPPPAPSGTLIESSSAAVSSTTHSRPTATSKHTKHCNASDIACPRCNRAQVEDPSGITYQVLCDKDLYSESHYAIQHQLTPEGCMAACDHFTDCGGSTFWPEGNCELARGDDVFPLAHARRTAFLSVNLSYTPPPPQLSAYPTVFPPPIYSSTSPNYSGCNRAHVRCPQCDGLQIKDGLNESYRVRCDLQPICRTALARYNVKSANSCLERCDADATCLAAIYERGRCVLCQGSIESLTPYLLPHDYVIFLAEPVLNGSSLPIASGEPHPSVHSNCRSSSTYFSISHSRTWVTRTSTMNVSPSPAST